MSLTKEEQKKLEAYEKMVESRKRHTARRQAKINIILRKAAAAGIVVSDAEIDAELLKK